MNQTELAKKYEHYETDQWAIDALLKVEILSKYVLDPCTGDGRIAESCKKLGYDVTANDIHDWGYHDFNYCEDFLSDRYFPHQIANQTVIFNPPFSLATEFVEKCFSFNARKVVCFQRFAWWESQERREFWDKHPPNRIYACGDRATCWRHDLPKDSKGNRFDPDTGKKLAGSSTAHAWFIWERGQPPGTLIHRIYKDAN